MVFRHGRRKPLSDENSRNPASSKGAMAGSAEQDFEGWRRTEVNNLPLNLLAKHFACELPGICHFIGIMGIQMKWDVLWLLGLFHEEIAILK